MANPFFSGRIPPGLADKIDAYLLTTGETRSELLIRLLRAEISDNKSNNNSDNITENKNDDILLDLIARVQKLEEAADNKSDNIPISLAFHEDDDKVDNKEDLATTDDKPDNKEGLMTIDDKSDNKEDLVTIDNKIDNSLIAILQENRIAVELTSTQLIDLIKIHERKKVTKAKSKKLLDLGVICEIGGDSILTKLGEAILKKYQT